MMRVLLRSWWRSPLLTAQFSLTIVVGVGAMTAIVSLMLALGYQPLPYRDPGQLVALWERSDSGAQVMAISGPDLAEFERATLSVFSAFGAFAQPPFWLLDPKGATPIRACYIQANAFSDLGIRPVLGREVRPDDEPITSGTTPPAWVSYRLWQSRYGGSRSVIGKTIGIAQNAAGLDEVRVQVAGVLPSGVSIPLPFMETATDVWFLLPRDLASRPRESTVFFGLGRLRRDVTVEQAQAALDVAAGRLARSYALERGKRPVVESLETIAQGPARQTMGLLALGVGFVFLVACVNLAILMGAEGRRRRREIAVRSVLGASRSRLCYEVAAEKCLLTLVSLGLGIWFALEMVHVLTVLMPSAGLGPALQHPPPLNLAVLLSFSVFALVAALVWSALLVRAADTSGSSRTLTAAGSGLGYTGLSDSSRGSNRWRLVLLATQAGIGVCLLAAAALTARIYAVVSTANLGPAPRNTVLMSFDPRDNVILSEAQDAEFNRQALMRLGRLPGTEAVALAGHFPPPNFPAPFMKQGDTANTEREATSPMPITPGYFRALGIPILFGRGFSDSDNKGAEAVAIISLDMAEQNWHTPEEAVGAQIAMGKDFKEHHKIVGVVANFTGYWSQKPVPTIYLPESQYGYCCSNAILRTLSPRAVAALAPQSLAGMPIPATISDVSTMEARWQATLTRPLARMAGMLLLALLGLGLSVQGVYAVTAAAVAARRHELAVRATLGALPGRLAWTVTRELIFAVLVGSACGVVAALILRPVLQHWLGPVAVWQAEPIAVAVILLGLTAGLSCYVPARSAARANPADVLRQG